MSHSNESVVNWLICITQKEPVKYTNKLIIKWTTDTKLQRILAVNKTSNTG